MSLTIIGWVGLFWTLQIAANLFFKWGSDGTFKWIHGFLLGHTFAITSMAVLMLLYKYLNPNIAFGVAFGGAFLFSQFALAWVFQTQLNWIQYGGVAAIALGMIALAAGNSVGV